MSFDPDAWLAGTTGKPTSGGFDPDAYLQKKAPGFFTGLKGSLKRGLTQAGQSVDAASLAMGAGLTEDANREPEKIAAERLADPSPDPAHFAPGEAGQRAYKRAVEKHQLRETERAERLKNNARFSEAMTKGKLPALAQAVGRRQTEIADTPRSEAMQQWDNATTLGAALAALAKHPVEVIANVAVEGLGSSAPALALTVAGAATAGPVGMITGQGTGSFAMEYGTKIVEELQKAGADFTRPETVIPLIGDRKRMQAIRLKAVRRGVPVAFFDALSAGFAGRLFRQPAKKVVGKLAQGATEVAAQAVTGGAGEAAGSVAAGDPVQGKDVLAEMIGEIGSGAGEVITGAATRDTGQNVPERATDLRAQQKQLVQGDRAVQMFPTGTKELPLPKNMQRVETPRGVFHYNPRRMTADEILSKSQAGQENQLLGLGPYSKREVERRAAAGEPVAVVTERGPKGEELRAALATESTAAETRAAMEAGKSNDSTVQLEKLGETLTRRELDDEIEQSLPDLESRDYVRGRSQQDRKRQLQAKVPLPELLRQTVDDLVLSGIDPKALDAIDSNLNMLTDKAYRKRLKLRAKVTADQINNVLGNTVLPGAIGPTRYFSLITALAQSPEHVATLRNEIARAKETPAAAPAPTAAPQPAAAPDRRDRVVTEADRLGAQLALQEKIKKQQQEETQRRQQIADKKAKAEQALQVAAEQRKAETTRLRAIEKTGRDPESGLIVDLQKVPTRELENFDWEKDRYLHNGNEVQMEDIDALLERRFRAEEKNAANGDEAGYTLAGLLKGNATELRAAGLASPLRLLSPKEASARGSLGEEHAALRERTGGFAYFSDRGLAEDMLQEQLAELGFDAPDSTAAYELVERAMNGEEITPSRGGQSQVQFARRGLNENRRPPLDRSTIGQPHVQWWNNFKAIAPGLAEEFALRFGSPEALVQSNLVQRAQLTGNEEAAYIAKQKIFYLFDQALHKNSDAITRLNLQHEMGHAFWDTLDNDTQLSLYELWQREMNEHTGPLFGAEGQLHDFVALDVTEDIKEWFAERMAHANDQWAQRRQAASNSKNTLLETLAAQFRALLLRLREFIERQLSRAGYNDQLLRDFRTFLNQGARWTAEEQQPVAFARRKDPGAGFDQALREFDRLERERDALLDAGRTVPREMLTQLSDARIELENSWPGWREDLKEQRAELEANDLAPIEPENGIEPLPNPDDQINPELTGAKISRVTASSYRPVSSLREWLSLLRKMFTNFKSAIPELPNNTEGRPFSRFRQGFRMMKAATEKARRDAEDRVAHVLEPISNLGETAIAPNEYRRLLELAAAIKKLADENFTGNAATIGRLEGERAALENKIESLPYHLFRTTVLFRDLWFRRKLLNQNGEPITLPQFLTREEVEGKLVQLHDKIKASPDRAAIEESLRRHYELVKTIREDLLERGYIIPEELRNPLYFPHLILDKFNGRMQSVRFDTAEDFRGYLQQLTGSAKDVESDYLTAMYYHVGQVLTHNAKQDIVETYWQPYDKTKELEAELKEINAKRRDQGLGPLVLQQIIPKDDVSYTVDDRIPLRPEYIINRQVLAERLGVELGNGDLQAQLREQGLDVTITADDLQQALGAGEKKKWIVPRPVADALQGIVERDTKSKQLLQRALGKPQTWWKWYKLFAPTSVVRYTYGNLVSDIEKLFSADPAVFRNLLPAYREVREFASGREATPDLKEAFKRGVIQTVTAGEVGEIKGAERFEAFLTSREKLQGMAQRGLQWGAKINQLREAAFRYAKFKTDLERLRNGARPVYAGAYWRDVEAITDSTPGANDADYAKAAEIARKTFVDYDDMTVSGDQLRRYWVPFYSWAEGNFKYHANLFHNLWDMSAGAGAAQLARGSLVAASKVVLPRSVTGVLLRLALPYAAVAIWNNTGDREKLEDRLSVEDRRRFHVILGQDEKGKVMVAYAPTALSDVAEWFGGNDFARLAGEYYSGTITLPQLVHEWTSNTPMATLNKVVQSLNPFAKTAIESLSRKNYFPDFTDARTIPDHDLYWHILGNMTDYPTADAIRRMVDKDYYSAKDFGDWSQQLILQVRRRDPEEWGYYATLDRVKAWQEAHGGTVDFGANNRADAKLLANFRKTLRAADVPAAIQFYHKLLATGYTAERFAASVRAADPLQTLKREYRQQFFAELSPAAQEDVKNAYRYVQRMEAFKRHEKKLFPRDKASEAYKSRFAQQPRDDVFAGLILESDTRDDATEELHAEQLLSRALRPR